MEQNQNNYSPAPAPQPMQQAPQCQQPAGVPAAGYSGGQKAAWLFIGLFIGIAGILLGNVVNVDNPVRRSEAMKFAAIGLVITLVLGFLVFAMAGCPAAMLAGSSSYYAYR